MVETVLTLRALNRATLARQLLLPGQRRPTALRQSSSEDAVLAALEHVAGLQAQASRAGYLGLWARIPGFDRAHLDALLHKRLVVKATLMRGTIHLVTATDYLLFRAALQPSLTRLAESFLRRAGSRLALEELAAEVKPFFAEPRTLAQLRAVLRRADPDADTQRLAYAVRAHLALIHAPLEGATWGFPTKPLFVDAEAWLGQPVPAATGPRGLILRYLAAFGPATAADIATWSGLRGLKRELEQLRPELARFLDENGAELLDVPDGLRPAADAPAPPRFVPEWDNVLLAHADRRRIVAEELQQPFYKAAVQLIGPAVLLDGFAVGRWKLQTERDIASLLVSPLKAIEANDREALAREGERLATFMRPEASGTEVRFVEA